jgi:regulator of sigma E protease
MDFKVDRIEKNLFSVLGYSFSKAALTVKMCGESLIDLMTGRYTLAAVSGPVGISQVIGQAANQGVTSLLSIVSLISINLGAMNLLPIPALDGGRTLMILIEMITKKKLPPNVEATINAVGLIVLLGLSVIIMIKDVIGLFG